MSRADSALLGQDDLQRRLAPQRDVLAAADRHGPPRCERRRIRDAPVLARHRAARRALLSRRARVRAGGLDVIARDTMLDALRDFCDSVFAPMLEPGKQRLAERTPLHALHTGLIGDVYPDARIVHIVRDGRDVVRSLLAQQWGPQIVAEGAREWRASIESPAPARRDRTATWRSATRTCTPTPRPGSPSSTAGWSSRSTTRSSSMRWPRRRWSATSTPRRRRRARASGGRC